LFHSSADALFVAVKSALICRAWWATCANTTKDHFFGQQQRQEDGILASTFGLVSYLSSGAEPPWSWKKWTYSSRVLGCKPVATHSCSLLMSQLFAEKSRRLSERHPVEFVSTIDSAAAL